MTIAKNLYVGEKQIAGAIGALIVGAFIASGLASATPSGAQARQQALEAPAGAKSTMTDKAAVAPAASMEFEVASIKLSNTASGGSRAARIETGTGKRAG
jgi:hypothetical protein